MHAEILLGNRSWENPLSISTCGRGVGSMIGQRESLDVLQSQGSYDSHAYFSQLEKRGQDILLVHVQASLAFIVLHFIVIHRCCFLIFFVFFSFTSKRGSLEPNQQYLPGVPVLTTHTCRYRLFPRLGVRTLSNAVLFS